MDGEECCDWCGALVPIEFLEEVESEDEVESKQREELVGIPWPAYKYERVCPVCLEAEYLDPAAAIDAGTPITTSPTSFQIRSFKGKVAQAIVETVLLEFKYDVFPYGYESYFTTIIKSLSKAGPAGSSLKIRTMPDLVAFDPQSKVAHLVEVKATTVVDPARYMLGQRDVDRYLRFWPEALLVVVMMRSQQIYGQTVSKLEPRRRLSGAFCNGKPAYVFNLHEDFAPLEKILGFKRSRYEAVLQEVWDSLRACTVPGTKR